MAFVFKKV